MSFKSLHSKILFLTVCLLVAGVGITIYFLVKHEETEHLEEKLRSSRFMAHPILNAIHIDMQEGRADMVRNLIASLNKVQGLDGLYIVRANGKEEAFKDLKTINEVKRQFGSIRPEWLANHPDEPENIARHVDTPDFKKAYEAYARNMADGEMYYIDRTGGGPVFTYLYAINKVAVCNKCHAADGARGILVIRMPLADLYQYLAKKRTEWIVSGILSIGVGALLLSFLIKRSITGPIQENVDVIKRITEGGNISERVKVVKEDEVGYLAKAFNDMLDTLERRAEENKKLFDLITKSKEEWVATFDAIQDLISIHDRDYRILKVNRALAKKLNLEPEALVGKSCHEVFYCKSNPHLLCPHTRTLSSATANTAEVDDMVFDGSYSITTFPVFNAKGEVWASVHIARDITQEKFLRAQLLHSEKLSSVGKLVAGIAHELNNPLMGIMGFSQILMDTPGDKKVADIKEKLNKIYHESLRTAKIVQNLLTFARTKKTEREFQSVNDIIKHTIEFREYSLRSNNIKVTLDLDPRLPRTMVDLFQMQQVFVNIINNAEDAMVARKAPGSLEIRTRKMRGKIEITFKDTGPGIPKEIINKVFDPFFTTKDVGKGTGLGLSITHGIIVEHGGSIDIISPEAGGAMVVIELPIVEKEQWATVKKAVESSSTGAQLSGKSILIADDELSIREALHDILARQGYRVETASDGKEAMSLLDKNRFSLIITDVKMPGMSGMELYDAVSSKHAYLKDKIIILTGDVFSQDIKDFIAKRKCPFILKPFEPKELSDIVRQVLSA